jgi:HEPN/Toprim N-terminal domain 1
MMGSYASCWLGQFHVGDSKSDVDPNLIELFRGTEKVVTTEFDELPESLKRHYRQPTQEDDEREYPFVFYRAPISVIADRLDFMGYTLLAATEAFVECMRREREQHEERLRDSSQEEWWRFSVDELLLATPEAWIKSLQDIRREGLTEYSWEEWKRKRGTLLALMLQYNPQGEWYGYPGWDKNIPLRLAMEACPDEDELVYDLTDLVPEYIDPKADVAQERLASAEDEFAHTGRVVVLTEGKFDAWVLAESLNLLFPHLRQYYSFMEFEAFRIGGGTGALANMVKAFAGAGIVNRTVALFDNDAAGADAIRSMPPVNRKNLRILQLPSQEFLFAYPTMGPSGLSNMDVNGLAASIELYLGRDVLEDAGTKQLIPVQWTGYMPGVGKYQGEILRRSEVQDRFRAKLQRCCEDRSRIQMTDWSGIRAVLSILRTAFHELDAKLMHDLIRQQYEGPSSA